MNGEIRRTKEELLTSLDKLELLQEREGNGYSKSPLIYQNVFGVIFAPTHG